MDFLQAKLKKAVSGKKRRYQEDGFDLDLTYITTRVIAMGFPSSGTEGLYRNPIDEVIKFFDKYHKNHFRIYNLCSERDYDIGLFENRVERFPFDDHNPPPHLAVYSLMELSKDPQNMVAVHCKAGKGRTGLIIASLIVHNNYLKFGAPMEALKFFGTIRTKNGHGVTIPSQRRFVRYYDYSLKFGFPIEDRKVSLNSIVSVTVPHFDPDGGCDPYITIVNMKGDDLYDSRKAGIKLKHFKPSEKGFQITGMDITLSGDFKVIVWDADVIGKNEKMFWFWLNSNFITGKVGEMSKMDLTRDSLDNCVKDKKFKEFDENFKVDVEFKVLSDGKRKKLLAPTSVNLGNPIQPKD